MAKADEVGIKSLYERRKSFSPPSERDRRCELTFYLCYCAQLEGPIRRQLRANAHRRKKSAIKSNWFQQTVLAPENFGRFNDDIIQASILRAAHPYEMNLADAPTDSRELGRLIRRIILAADTERGGAAAEFLFALAIGRLRLCRADLEIALSAEPGAVPMVEFLRRVCKMRLAG